MSYINWFKRVFVGNGSDNTAEGAIIRAGGKHTTIRFNYTTTDAPINAQIKVDCVWVDIDSGTIVAV